MTVLGLVLLWRLLLLVFTAQPIPANDAFAYDGAVINYLHTGHYCNPSLAIIFPISGNEVFSMYPPLYQGALLVWMKFFGTSVLAAMFLHLALFAISGFLTLGIVKRFLPATTNYALAALLFFGFTFGDRPESLAYVFGLCVLWLTARQISENNFSAGRAMALLVLLLLGLYTSVIVGAYFFGTAFLACAMAWCWRRKWNCFLPFIGAAFLFCVITFAIVKLEPRWWAGFLESAREQSVAVTGFHAPHVPDVIKLVRTAPVFVLGLFLLPMIYARRKELFATESAWLALITAVFVMGWAMLIASMTFLASNYVAYVMFTQVILAAGLLVLVQKYFTQREQFVRVVLAGCVLLVAVRAVGLSTWGVACASKNSYRSTQTELHTELGPFVQSDRPVLLSSAFLYTAADMQVKTAIDCDWYFDHADWTDQAMLGGLTRLQPAKLVLTQFDYYRSFAPLLDKLGQHPEQVEIHLHNLAQVKPPDAIPSLQRVVQHISWAPVIVDLSWKTPPPPQMAH